MVICGNSCSKIMRSRSEASPYPLRLFNGCSTVFSRREDGGDTERHRREVEGMEVAGKDCEHKARVPILGALPKSKLSTAVRFLLFFMHTPCLKASFRQGVCIKKSRTAVLLTFDLGSGGRIDSLRSRSIMREALPKSKVSTASRFFFYAYTTA